MSNQSIPRMNIISRMYTPCTKPLASLQRMILTELMSDNVHRGKYVLFKTLAEGRQDIGIQTVVQDPDGNLEKFIVYNHDLNRRPSDVLPVGSIIALKEPYYEKPVTGNAVLRCDHPQDMVYLSADDPLVQQITWESGIPKVASSESTKLQGNEFFKQGRFYDAVLTYTKSLTLVSSSSDIVALYLNRAAAFLKLEYYEAALEDCRCVLEIDGQNRKALYRSAKAYYALEEYEQALIKMQLYAQAETNEVEMEYELKMIRDRLKEQQYGTYDWNAMIDEARTSSTPRLNHASYVGPVRIANLSNERSRGLILTQNVLKGELLLCSKAFQICYSSEAESVVYINRVTKRDDTPAQTMLTQKILHKLINNPSLSKSVYDLYAGKDRQNQIPSIISTPPVIDILWISDICSMNVFGNLDLDLNPRLQQNISTDADSCALFLMPSYINHACLGNCVRSFIGDMMVVRALDNLPAGTELLMPYADIFAGVDERRLSITKHQTVCNCRLCELDEMESRTIRDRRNEAFQIFQNEIFLKIKQGLIFETKTEDVISQIEKTYEDANRKELKIRMCPQLMVLARVYISCGKLDKCIQTCMKILKIHDYGTQKSTWTNCLFPAMAQLILMYYTIGETQLGHLWLEKLRTELSITSTGDDRLFVKEYRELYAEYGVKLSNDR